MATVNVAEIQNARGLLQMGLETATRLGLYAIAGSMTAGVLALDGVIAAATPVPPAEPERKDEP